MAYGNATQDDLSSTERKSPLFSGVLWVFAAIIGIVAFFWGGIVSLFEAWALPEYSHGPIIPLIAGFLFLREIRAKPYAVYDGNRWLGLVIIGLGLVLGLSGNLTNIPDIITYGMLLSIGGLILVIAGSREGKRFWAGWVYLFFMLPLPNFIYWPLSIKLQFISSKLGVELIYLLDIPVFLDGNIIDLGIYKLQVAEACNGLRYLFPLMSFGFLFAVLYNGPLWHRVLLFVSTMPITILMNSFRIGVIGVLVNQYGIEQAEGFLHFFEGWIIFIACLALLYFEAFLLQRLTRNPQPIANILDLDMTGIFKPLTTLMELPATRTLIAGSLMMLLAGSAWQLAPQRHEVNVDRRGFDTFPMHIDDWKGRATTLDLTIEKVLGADDYLIADFNSSSAKAPVNLFMSFYDSQTQGSGIHSPEVCIPGSGWEVSRWAQTPISIGESSPVTFTVNRAIIQKGINRQLVYYWFEQRGNRTTSDYEAKFITVKDSLLHGRTDGGLIRLVTPIRGKDGDAEADQRLINFLKTTMPILPQYMPPL